MAPPWLLSKKCLHADIFLLNKNIYFDLLNEREREKKSFPVDFHFHFHFQKAVKCKKWVNNKTHETGWETAKSFSSSITICRRGRRVKKMPNLLVLYVYFHNFVSFPFVRSFLVFFFGVSICAVLYSCYEPFGRGLMRKEDIVYSKEHMKCFSIM
jgi:hypothetical protein